MAESRVVSLNVDGSSGLEKEEEIKEVKNGEEKGDDVAEKIWDDVVVGNVLEGQVLSWYLKSFFSHLQLLCGLVGESFKVNV